MKITAKDLYVYQIMTDGKTTANSEMDGQNIWSNYKQDEIRLFPEYPEGVTDEFGEPIKSIRLDNFVQEASGYFGALFLSSLRERSPILVFIQSDMTAIRIFPQYNMN